MGSREGVDQVDDPRSVASIGGGRFQLYLDRLEQKWKRRAEFNERRGAELAIWLEDKDQD